MSGIVGRMFREFALVLTIAVVVIRNRVADAHANDVRPQLLRHTRPSMLSDKPPGLPRTVHGERLNTRSISSTSRMGACAIEPVDASRSQPATLAATHGMLYVTIPKGFLPAAGYRSHGRPSRMPTP